MDTIRFTSELDRTLARAAEGMALARMIEASLREITPCNGQERLWRRRMSI